MNAILDNPKYVEDAYVYVGEQISEAAETAISLGANESQVARLRETLRAVNRQLKPFTISMTDTMILFITWDDVDEHIVRVSFNTDDSWEWDVRDNTNGNYTSFCGGPSFVYGDKKFYYIPTHVDKLIMIKDEFSKIYEPIINRWEYDVAWVTGKHDGMTAGYVYWKNRLHYARMLEETDYERDRIFGIYSLTDEQIIAAYKAHMEWKYIQHANVLRYLYKRSWVSRIWTKKYWIDWWKWRVVHKLVGSPDYDKIHKKQERIFKETHGEPIAYFKQ